MGKVSRLLTLDPRTRRLRLPREYLEHHHLTAGASLHILVTGPGTRCLMTESQWKFLSTAAHLLHAQGGAPGWVEDHAKLDKQGRVIIPEPVSFRTNTPRVRLRYTLQEGILALTRADEGDRLETDADPVPPEPAERPGSGAPGLEAPRSTTPRVPTPPQETPPTPAAVANMENPIRPEGLFPPGPVQDVRLDHIKGVDPSLPAPEPDENLADQIAEDGMRDPVVLHGHRPYRVIDGWKRIRVALYLEMTTVPAVVFSRLDRRDVQALRYLLDTRSGHWRLGAQLRRLAILRQNGASIEELARLIRRRPRTVQRYLRVALRPDLVTAIESGKLSLREAEKRVGSP